MKRSITIISLLLAIMTTLRAEEMRINVTVGSRTFAATLADSETGRAFYNMLPLTLNMSELNGNEKYCYLDTSLPTATYRPGTINTGDLMLYGSSCVVLFYETFSSGYSYTRLGTLTDPAGLADALGAGAVTVGFEKVSSSVTAVSAVEGDVTVDTVSDINGRQMPTSDLASLPRGIYVVKYSNGATRKVIK